MIMLLPMLSMLFRANAQLATADCAGLQNSFTFANTTILNATKVDANVNLTVPGDPSCMFGTVTTSVPICRVEILVNTTSTSRVHMEAWLPDTWFGRFLGLGNGGLGGCKTILHLHT